MGQEPEMNDKLNIGAVRSLKIDVLSETGWFDDALFKQNMADYGGAAQSQYRVAWDPENAGGYSALLTVTLLDGTERKILLDTGWNNEWMDYVFARHRVDQMLERGEIDLMVLSHWHLDHFWGIEQHEAQSPAHTLCSCHMVRAGSLPAGWEWKHRGGMPRQVNLHLPQQRVL